MVRFHRHAEPFSFPALTTTLRLLGGPSLLMGWGLLETAGAATTVEIWDGFDTTGQLVVPISLSANQSTRDWNSPDGIYCSRGLFINVTQGTVRGVLWARLRDVGVTEAVA